MCLKAFGECGQAREVRLPAGRRGVGPAGKQSEATISKRSRAHMDVYVGNLLTCGWTVVDSNGKIPGAKFCCKTSLNFYNAFHQCLTTF